MRIRERYPQYWSCGGKLSAFVIEEQPTVKARCVGMTVALSETNLVNHLSRGSQRLTLTLKRPQKRSIVYVLTKIDQVMDRGIRR